MDANRAADLTLEQILGRLYSDPLAFVLWAFDWGQGALKDEEGPDEWQRQILADIRDNMMDVKEALRYAVASGHGIGKTALICWLILWFICTRPNPQIIVTSNTGTQLATKTWRELSKWHQLIQHKALRDRYEHSATAFRHVEAPLVWFASPISWSKDRSEAFAGAHEDHVLVLFDEASLIDDSIWEVTEGAMTTEVGPLKTAIWIAFGNPTRNTGRFRECFGRFRHRWRTRQIDSRTSRRTNKKQIQQWIDDYGEDSDFVRVRIKGEFPRASSTQFISSEIAEAATKRVITEGDVAHSPVVIGVDVARFGDDASVIYVRRGLATLAIRKYRLVDNMDLVGHVITAIKEFGPDAVFVDSGNGSGVIDRLRQLGHRVVEVHFGGSSSSKAYFNKRAQMWGDMRDWLKAGGQIPEDRELVDDLTGIEYGFGSSDDIQLEKKEHMKARGVASPDIGDALALTFAFPVESRVDRAYNERAQQSETYNPLSFYGGGRAA